MLRNISKFRPEFFRLLATVAVLHLSVTTLSAQVESKADQLLRQMTLEEKIAQLSQMPGFPIAEFEEQNHIKPEEAVRKYGAGSVLWVSEPKEINRWQHIAVDRVAPAHSYSVWARCDPRLSHDFS